MPCRTLSIDDVVVRIEALPEEIPVRGNACDTGDEQFDHQVEHEILNRLARDDVWAWATVIVTASWEGQESTEYLGCCCYEDEQAFRKGGYFADMVDAALSNLNRNLHNLYRRLSMDYET